MKAIFAQKQKNGWRGSHLSDESSDPAVIIPEARRMVEEYGYWNMIALFASRTQLYTPRSKLPEGIDTLYICDEETMTITQYQMENGKKGRKVQTYEL